MERTYEIRTHESGLWTVVEVDGSEVFSDSDWTEYGDAVDRISELHSRDRRREMCRS